MQHHRPPFAAALLWAAAALALLAGAPGCGPGKPKIHRVEGKLTVGGQPAADVRVAFHPRGGKATTPPVLSVGTTDADGAFRLTTYSAGDGAPAGEYVVTLVWPDTSIPQDECAEPTAHDRLNNRYSDPEKSPLRATVRPGDNVLPLRASVAGNWSLPRMRDAARKDR